MKILYFHIPKTGGSSLNSFFSSNIPNSITHIEKFKNLDKNKLKQYNFISGHIRYNRMNLLLDLKEWTTIASFREPLEYTISHLKWVRKLAENKKRLKRYTKTIQKVVSKMETLDFSLPKDIFELINWLEKNNIYYFHNTQTLYVNQRREGSIINDREMLRAIEHLNSLDFITIQNDLENFMNKISNQFHWKIENKPYLNINQNNYGLDITNKELVESLYPLYEKDLILYEEVVKNYQKQMKYLEKQENSSFSK